MCTNKQRSDVPFPLPFLPVSAACRVGVENEWKWRSGVDKIRGERQEGCGHGRRGREHAEVPLRRVFRTPAEDRNWQTECATSWWQPSFQPYFTQVCMKSCQIVFLQPSAVGHRKGSISQNLYMMEILMEKNTRTCRLRKCVCVIKIWK